MIGSHGQYQAVSLLAKVLDVSELNDEVRIIQECALSHLISIFPRVQYEELLRDHVVLEDLVEEDIEKQIKQETKSYDHLDALTLRLALHRELYPQVWKQVNQDAGRINAEVEDRLRRYDSQSKLHALTSLDAVLITKGPEAIPLLAFEYDGEGHATNRTQVENDQLKDAICVQAYLLLLRLTVSGLAPHERYPERDVGKRLRREFASSFFRSAVRVITKYL
jgi:hypothetical protein